MTVDTKGQFESCWVGGAERRLDFPEVVQYKKGVKLQNDSEGENEEGLAPKQRHSVTAGDFDFDKLHSLDQLNGDIWHRQLEPVWRCQDIGCYWGIELNSAINE